MSNFYVKNGWIFQSSKHNPGGYLALNVKSITFVLATGKDIDKYTIKLLCDNELYMEFNYTLQDKESYESDLKVIENLLF